VALRKRPTRPPATGSRPSNKVKTPSPCPARRGVNLLSSDQCVLAKVFRLPEQRPQRRPARRSRVARQARSGTPRPRGRLRARLGDAFLPLLVRSKRIVRCRKRDSRAACSGEMKCPMTATVFMMPALRPTDLRDNRLTSCATRNYRGGTSLRLNLQRNSLPFVIC
jgi:hypothetical protein